MSDQPLRAACDHGRYDAHEVSTWTGIKPPRGKKLRMEPCPGGRDITSDHDAAFNAAKGKLRLDETWEVIDAALGLDEDAAAIGDTDD